MATEVSRVVDRLRRSHERHVGRHNRCVDELTLLCRTHLRLNVEERTEPYGVRVTRRHLSGYLSGMRGASALRQQLNTCDSLEGCLAILDTHRAASRLTAA